MFGLIAVFLTLLARYRHLRQAFAAFIPAVRAAATTMGLLGLLGQSANLMHLISLLLVLSMGVDYGVFLSEGSRHKEGLAPAFLSIIMACLSTLLAFGLLAMSDMPALKAVGLTTGLGVLWSW